MTLVILKRMGQSQVYGGGREEGEKQGLIMIASRLPAMSRGSSIITAQIWPTKAHPSVQFLPWF